MYAAHETIKVGEETQRSSNIKGSDKGVASDISYNAFCAKKQTVHYIDYIGAQLVRGRVCYGPSLWGPSLFGAEMSRNRHGAGDWDRLESVVAQWLGTCLWC